MKRLSEFDTLDIAPCGINCLACGAYLNAKSACPGCRAETQQHQRKSCQNCAKKACAFAQGLSWCYECARFPCQKITAFDRVYRQRYGVSLVQNGLDAKGDMAAFLVAQRLRYTCLACGGTINQHSNECSACGKKSEP